MQDIEGNALLLGESRTVEYKETVPSQSEKYLKTIIAFANGEGGRLVFGIEDGTRKVVGLKNDTLFKTMDAITNAISDNCEPRLCPDISLQNIGDKTILIVSVDSGQQKPYYLKSKGPLNGTYQRVAGTTRLVSDYRLKELILEGSNRSYDRQPCSYLKVTDKDIESLCENLYQKALKNTLDETAKKALRRPTKNVLISWGILQEANGLIIPTIAYALLTGQLQDMPYIQCAIFRGDTRAEFLDHRDIKGAVQDQLDGAILYVMEKLNRSIQIKGMYGVDRYELPIDSVRELIANAIAHRSYLDPGLIQIALYDNRLEITSPGMLLSGVTLQRMKEGFSKIRNKALAEAFTYMRIIEHWGSGIPRFLKDCQEYGLPPPQLIDFESDFRVNVFRNRIQPAHTNTFNLTTSQINTQPDDQATSQINCNHTDKNPSQINTQPNDQATNQIHTQPDNQATSQIRTQLNNQTTIKSGQNERQPREQTLSENSLKLLNAIKTNPHISQNDLAAALGWKLSAVKYYITKLRKIHCLKRLGSARIGRWKVNL